MKDIPNYPGYKIDENGTVFSFRKRGAGFGKLYKKGIPLKPFIDQDGYSRISLYKDAAQERFIVSRLMLKVFKPCDSKGLIARHMDGNPANNHIDNLEWGTFIDNEADKRRHGRIMTGSRNHNAKLNEDKVWILKKLLLLKINQYLLGSIFGVAQSVITDINRNRIWKHVTI